jgi:hypothetical protein
MPVRVRAGLGARRLMARVHVSGTAFSQPNAVVVPMATFEVGRIEQIGVLRAQCGEPRFNIRSRNARAFERAAAHGREQIS